MQSCQHKFTQVCKVLFEFLFVLFSFQRIISYQTFTNSHSTRYTRRKFFPLAQTHAQIAWINKSKPNTRTVLNHKYIHHDQIFSFLPLPPSTRGVSAVGPGGGEVYHYPLFFLLTLCIPYSLRTQKRRSDSTGRLLLSTQRYLPLSYLHPLPLLSISLSLSLFSLLP